MTIPFYIFNLEKDFPVYNVDPRKIKQEYNKFVAGIDKAVEKKKISAYQRRVILDMSKKILENIAKNFKNVRKGVSEIMGGRVLEHEGKTILNEGIARGIVIGEERGIAIGEARGIEIGEARGKELTLNEAIDFMRSKGLSNEDINQFKNFMLNR